MAGTKVDHTGFDLLIGQVNGMHSKISESGTLAAPTSAECGDSNLQQAVKSLADSWNSEIGVALDALAETARKLRQSRDRYKATDAASMQGITNITIAEAATTPTGTGY